MEVIVLNELIREVITRVYLDQDYEYFKQKCKENMSLPEEFHQILQNEPKVIRVNCGSVSPAEEWYVHFGKVNKGEFIVAYKTGFKLSKIVPVFYVQHEFEVVNKDEERIGPVLDGFSNEAYCKRQYEFQEKLVQCLVDCGYTELSYAEMNEVICEVQMPKGRGIFGPQVTVETAIFRDVYELGDA